MHLFYHPDAPTDGTIVLHEEEMRHLRALRIRENEHVLCTDGKGNVHTCHIVTEKKSSTLHVISSAFSPEKLPRLTLAVAPTKNQDRMEWLIEKAVEIGLHAFIPILCEHSEKSFLKLDRLQRVAIAAMKQSQKYHLPHLLEPVPFHEIAEASYEQKFIAHCADDADKKMLSSILQPHTDALVCIGPEGDFSANEITKAKQHGFSSISLGNERLRTETAGLVATTLFQFKQYP